MVYFENPCDRASGAGSNGTGPVERQPRRMRRRQPPPESEEIVVRWEFSFSRAMLQLAAALIGGFGIYCLFMSFFIPSLGAQAFLCIGAATAMVHLHP